MSFKSMDNLHYTLIFDPPKFPEITFKSGKISEFGREML